MPVTHDSRGTPPPQILLMEDEQSLAKGLEMALQETGYEVTIAPDGRNALKRFDEKPFDLLLADLRLPDIDGMEVIRRVKRLHPDTAVVVITGYATVPSAVEAIKTGAYDYLPKPFTDDDIKTVIRGALQAPPSPPAAEGSKPVEAKKHGPPTAREPEPVERGRTSRILLVEDEVTTAQGLRMVLTEAGYEVESATTGQTALDTVKREGFDVLIADLRLPDIDGMEVIRRVKENRPETEVIVITGYATVASAIEAMKLGIFDYLPKPFTEDEVKSVVAGAVAARQSAIIRSLLECVDEAEGKLIQKREVVCVLERASQDEHFWHELMDKGSVALASYALSSEAKAAIVSGDLNWIHKHVGELTDHQLRWIRSRLEMERW